MRDDELQIEEEEKDDIDKLLETEDEIKQLGLDESLLAPVKLAQ